MSRTPTPLDLMDVDAPEPAPIPGDVARWLHGRVGAYTAQRAPGAPWSRNGVWRVSSDVGAFFLKLHQDARRWHQEVHAYRHWAPVYGPLAPRLVDTFQQDGRQGILLTALPGTPLRTTPLPRAKALAVYRQAGALARQLHALGPGTWFGSPDCHGQPLDAALHDPVAYQRAELEFCYERAQPVLDRAERDLAEWALAHAGIYAGERPVPINQDYTPGNWLVDEDGELTGVVDFEGMRWSVLVDPFAILWDRFFGDDAEAEAAFFSGYGSQPRQSQPLQVRHICIKIALADLGCWVHDGSERHRDWGHATLRRWM